VLDELDKSKKGVEPVNVKTREVIRYLERRTKSRTIPTEGSANGSLHLQAQQDMFPQWEECGKLAVRTDEEIPAKEDIPRYLRAMINCVLWKRSKGDEFWIVTQNVELMEFARIWGIQCKETDEITHIASAAVEAYHQDLKAFQTRQRTSSRTNPKDRKLWTPRK
jgi:hypothetical protein